MELNEIARELEVATTWHSGARGRKLRDLADALWEHAGGKQEPVAGDERLATPGPGVRSRTTADVAEVDSVGDIADTKPPATPQRIVTTQEPKADPTKTGDTKI